MLRRRIGMALVACATVGALPAMARAEGQLCLNDLEKQIEKDYTAVGSLFPHQAHDLLRAGEDVLLLDVRDAAEFEISHLPGAVLIDPEISADQFMARFGSQLAGKKVLLYCSVGVRSSRLGERIRAEAAQRGATGVYNIRGGIFAWHNYGKRLDRSKGQTELVHPYSTRWSRYLDFPNYTSFGNRPRWW
jgi:rhodanese-related sulfurtransferase